MPNDLFAQQACGLTIHQAMKNIPGITPEQPVAIAGRRAQWENEIGSLNTPTIPLAPQATDFRTRYHNGIQTFANRRSVRQFTDEAISREQLAQFLALSYPVEVTQPRYQPTLQPHTDFAPWNGHITLCKVVAIPLNVEGLAQGAYLYDEYGQTLRPFCDEVPQSILEEAIFQVEFLKAPVLFMYVGSFADALNRYGERGYRYLLMEAGLMLQQMYLVSAYMGIGGCTTGSIIQRKFDRWFGFDSYNTVSIQMFVIGHKIEEATYAA